jgi:hypothetical protein
MGQLFAVLVALIGGEALGTGIVIGLHALGLH